MCFAFPLLRGIGIAHVSINYLLRERAECGLEKGQDTDGCAPRHGGGSGVPPSTSPLSRSNRIHVLHLPMATKRGSPISFPSPRAEYACGTILAATEAETMPLGSGPIPTWNSNWFTTGGTWIFGSKHFKPNYGMRCVINIANVSINWRRQLTTDSRVRRRT